MGNVTSYVSPYVTGNVNHGRTTLPSDCVPC